ncbi:MAG: hypothetical protein ACK54Y_05705 [Bacteroidota bacterium]|jgi:hypothetical protein
MDYVAPSDKAMKARELLNCPVFKSILSDARMSLVEQMMSSKSEESTLRESFYARIKGLESINLILQGIINKHNLSKG